MRIPNLYLGKYRKSYNKTQKVIRTISQQRPYIQKQQKLESEMERELQEYSLQLEECKKLESEALEKLNNMIEAHRADKIQFYALLIYGIKLDKEKILEKLKARKAK